MAEIEDDFSLILDYLSKLFAIKNIDVVDVHEISVRYVGKCEIINGEMVASESFPEIQNLDRIVSLDIMVSNLDKSRELDLTISNDRFYSNNCSMDELRKLVDIFDRSTFRFF